jgi:hypothetical protein
MCVSFNSCDWVMQLECDYNGQLEGCSIMLVTSALAYTLPDGVGVP